MLSLQQRLFRFSPTGLFYSLWLSVYFLPSLHPILEPNVGNQIGEATMQGIDIATRTSEFYRFILYFICTWLLTNYLFSFSFFKPHTNYSSFNSTISKAGIVQVIAGLFAPALLPLAGLYAAVNIGIFICGKLPTKSAHTLSAPLAAAWTFIFWLQLIWWLPMSLTPIVHYIIWTIVFSSTLALIEQKFTLDTGKLMHWAFIFSFSVLSPFIVTEIHYLILLKSGVHVAPAMLTICYLFILFLLIILVQKNNWIKTTRPILFKQTWLIIAIGLGIQSFYVPYGIAPKELFELANRATPLMEMYYFQTLPLLSKASSHFVSDYGFGILYEFIYGYQGLDFLVFDVIENILWVVISYQLLYAITRKTLLSFYFVALFPFADAALSPYYILALIPLLILILAWRKPNAKQAWYFGISVVLLIPWRADLAFALIFCLLAVLGISLWLKKISWKFLLPTFYSALLLGIFLLFICIRRDIDWIKSLQLSLDYLNSSQSYGLTYMGDENGVYFKWEHFLLPILVIACLILAIRELFNKESVTKNLIPWLIIVFLCVFYIVNLPRGIVRHGFAEGFDNFLSSFAFFLIPLTFALKFPLKDSNKWMTWLGMMFVVMLFLRFPQRSPENTLLYSGIFNPVYQDKIPHKLTKRLKTNTAEIPPSIFQLVDFLKLELKENETFIDFGNTPMLYFYVQKPVPSFFYQSPQNIHSLSLQKDWLTRINNFQVPILLFRHDPKNWWDETDGLANEMRHSLMVEYFYQHYSPWQKRYGYEIWRLKDKDSLIPSEFDNRKWEHISLKKIPLFWHPELNSSIESKSRNCNSKLNTICIEVPTEFKNRPAYIELQIESKAKLEKDCQSYFMQDSSEYGGIDFSVLPNQESTYLIRPSIHYSWWFTHITDIRIDLGDSIKLKRSIFARPN